MSTRTTRVMATWLVVGIALGGVSLVVPSDWVVFRLACLVPLALFELLFVGSVVCCVVLDLREWRADVKAERREVKP